MTESPQLKRILTILFVFLLTALAFVIRLENFKKTTPKTIDEVVYYRLARQITRNISEYNTLELSGELKAKGKGLHAYFYQPLFKHPPVFALLNSIALRIFGDHQMSDEELAKLPGWLMIPVSSVIVSVLFGVLLIPMAFLLGALIYDRKTGLLAAFVLFLDPINVMCSQKVWMETTLVFFSMASIYFYVKGLKTSKTYLFLFGGVSLGLAALTKYPGWLLAPAMLFYVLCFHRKYFDDRMFLVSLMIPVVMFIPWLIWNGSVYGLNFLSKIRAFHIGPIGSAVFMKLISFLLGMAALVFMIARYASVIAEGFRNDPLVREFTAESKKNFRNMLCVLIAAVVLKDVFRGLSPMHIPASSWNPGLFEGEGGLFYFKKLAEFSLVYLFGFFSFVPGIGRDRRSAVLLKIVCAVYLVFYSIYGNFQSRYILVVTPFLIILGAHSWLWMLRRVRAKHDRFMRLVFSLFLLIIGVYSLFRLQSVNILLSFGNNMCYF